MKIAITGIDGIVGRHLAQSLLEEGHEIVLLGSPGEGTAVRLRNHRRVDLHPGDWGGGTSLGAALEGCDALAHCACLPGTAEDSRDFSGFPARTRLLAETARRAGVQRFVLAGFLRARPGCGLPWLENLWQAEEIIRHAGMEHLVVKCGLVYGPGDDFVKPLARTLAAWPLVVLPGKGALPVRPVRVDDVTRLLRSFLLERRPRWRTVAVTGPETVTLRQAVERVAEAAGSRITPLEYPSGIRQTAAWTVEKLFRQKNWLRPARLRLFGEPLDAALPYGAPPPKDLRPLIPFTTETIRESLPVAKARELEGFPEPRPSRR